MSNLNLRTPTRLNCGMIIPGFDTTKSALDPSSTLSYGGLPTPPQSADESRRPSLQYLTLMDPPFSASSSSFAYSHPNTPVHAINSQGHPLMSAYTENVEARLEPGSASSSTRRGDSFRGATLQTPFALQPSPIDAGYSQPPHHHDDSYGFELGVDMSATEGWRPPQQMLNGYETQPTFLGSALFPSSHSLVPDSHPVQLPHGHSPSSLHHQYDSTFHGYGATPLYTHAPQVVVPSQLSPQDAFPQHDWSEYPDAPPHSAVSASSFGSSAQGYLEYDMVDPPSPAEAYFAHSEDEDYMMIKPERMATPSKCHSSRWSTMTNSACSSGRSKRRPSRKLRNGAKGVAWHSHVSSDFGCLVQYEGRGFHVNDDGSIKVERATSKKPHKCHHVSADGKECARRFERSEHLKRHMGMHSDERKYFCPLKGCHKNIQRPDNAADHFKTHLRPKTKGKRNEHFEWHVLQAAIRSEYNDSKSANKLLTNLQRWVDSGMPEAPGSRRT